MDIFQESVFFLNSLTNQFGRKFHNRANSFGNKKKYIYICENSPNKINCLRKFSKKINWILGISKKNQFGWKFFNKATFFCWNFSKNKQIFIKILLTKPNSCGNYPRKLFSFGNFSVMQVFVKIMKENQILWKFSKRANFWDF